ncbi:hypothetical protein [Dyadobacter sp. 50-39]
MEILFFQIDVQISKAFNGFKKFEVIGGAQPRIPSGNRKRTRAK